MQIINVDEFASTAADEWDFEVLFSIGFMSFRYQTPSGIRNLALFPSEKRNWDFPKPNSLGFDLHWRLKFNTCWVRKQKADGTGLANKRNSMK